MRSRQRKIDKLTFGLALKAHNENILHKYFDSNNINV